MSIGNLLHQMFGWPGGNVIGNLLASLMVWAPAHLHQHLRMRQLETALREAGVIAAPILRAARRRDTPCTAVHSRESVVSVPDPRPGSGSRPGTSCPARGTSGPREHPVSVRLLATIVIVSAATVLGLQHYQNLKNG